MPAPERPRCGDPPTPKAAAKRRPALHGPVSFREADTGSRNIKALGSWPKCPSRLQRHEREIGSVCAGVLRKMSDKLPPGEAWTADRVRSSGKLGQGHGHQDVAPSRSMPRRKHAGSQTQEIDDARAPRQARGHSPRDRNQRIHVVWACRPRAMGKPCLAGAPNGCPTWIRTMTRRVKVACATITPSGSDGGRRKPPPQVRSRVEITARPARAIGRRPGYGTFRGPAG